MTQADLSSTRVLCYGDSNTWGYVGVPDSMTPQRLRSDQYWPGVMAGALGPGAVVQVNAVNGRRTNVDGHPDMAGNRGVSVQAFNGLLPAESAAMSASPLEAMVLMLGTNDLVITPPRTAQAIAAAVVEVGEALMRGAMAFCEGPPPVLMLISPPPLGGDGAPREDVPDWPQAWTRSRQLGAQLGPMARQRGWAFLDAADVIETDAWDLVHLSDESHRRLGLAVADAIRPHLQRRMTGAPS